MRSQHTSVSRRSHRRPKPGIGFTLLRGAGWFLKIVGLLMAGLALVGFIFLLAKTAPLLIEVLQHPEQKMAGFIFLVMLGNLSAFLVLGFVGAVLAGIGFACGYWGTQPAISGAEAEEKARVLVIGAGVNGSACAAGLHNAGIDVTVLARGQRYEEVRDNGIVIENPFNKKRTVARVPVMNSLAPEDRYDFVLVVVRKNQALELLPLLAQNRSPNIVFMGNNLSGPNEFIKALGRDRVMMGAVYAAGKRDGSLIRAIVIKSAAAPFGEIDGTITPRLKQLAAIFRQAGFKVELSTNIVDTQMTHALGVALIGTLIGKHGCNAPALARSTDDLKLFIEGRRESHLLQRSLGHQIVPQSEATLSRFPAFLQIAGLRLMLNSRLGEVGLAWHASKAPDEIQQLAAELQVMVDQSGLPVPAIRKILG
jgi:2-dehydropantoate 2-reductase